MADQTRLIPCFCRSEGKVPHLRLSPTSCHISVLAGLGLKPVWSSHTQTAARQKVRPAPSRGVVKEYPVVTLTSLTSLTLGVLPPVVEISNDVANRCLKFDSLLCLLLLISGQRSFFHHWCTNTLQQSTLL